MKEYFFLKLKSTKQTFMNLYKTSKQCEILQSRPAGVIKFFRDGVEVAKASEQVNSCDKQTGMCNSAADFDFLPTDQRFVLPKYVAKALHIHPELFLQVIVMAK